MLPAPTLRASMTQLKPLFRRRPTRASGKGRWVVVAVVFVAAMLMLTMDRSGRQMTPLSTRQLSILANSSYAAGPNRTRRVAIIAPTTYHYRHFLVNLQCSIERVAGRQALVFALDDRIAAFAKRRGYRVLGPFKDMKWKRDAGDAPHSYRSEKFRYITKMKLEAVRKTLLAGYDVLLTDVDVVWCDDAVQKLAKMIEEGFIGDVLIQSDSPRYSKDWVRINTGFYYAKATSHVSDLFEATIRFSSRPENSGWDDQKSFIATACNWTKLSEEAAGRANLTLCRWDDRVYVRALPIMEYLNGAVFVNGTRLGRLPLGQLRDMCMSKRIVMWHNNWILAHRKLERFQQQKLWFVNESSMECTANT